MLKNVPPILDLVSGKKAKVSLRCPVGLVGDHKNRWDMKERGRLLWQCHIKLWTHTFWRNFKYIQRHIKPRYKDTKTDLHLMLVYWSQSPTFWLMGEVHYVVARWSANTNLGIGKHKYTSKYLQIHKNTHKYNAYHRLQRVNVLSGRNLKQYFWWLSILVLLRDWEKDKKGQMFIWQIIFLSKAGLFLGCSGKKVT